MDQHGKDMRERGVKWWQDWRWIAAMAAFLAMTSFTVFVGTTVRTNDSVQNAEPVLEQLARISESNALELRRLEQSQQGIDELVAYVRRLQQEDEQDDRVDLQVFIDLLCADSDPVRVQKCEEIGAT